MDAVSNGRGVQSRAARGLAAPDWSSRTAPFAPGLPSARALGPARWRTGRWRSGKAELSEADGRPSRLAVTASWLTANAGEPRALAASGGQ
jgi:hypothetical protein